MADYPIEGVFEVAINGRPYRAFQEQHQRSFLQVIRQQADAAEEPSERSLNPEDLWRRSQDDWILGSGQRVYDDIESARKRYHDSAGVTPWTKGELSLLHEVERIDSLTGSFSHAVIAQDKLFIAGENTLHIWDGSSWSESSSVANTIRSLATDGTNVYIAERNDAADAGSIQILTRGSTTPALFNTVIPDLVAYERGRLLVSAGWAIFNIMDIEDQGPPDPITAAAINEEWVWDAFGSGMSYIYVSGHSDQLSMVYRISIREDGTALTPPVAATQLPDGEFVTAIDAYMGVILLGTTKGMRLAIPQGGSLQYGPLIETDEPVRAFEGQGRYVWFGADAGLMRADLSRFLPSPLDLAPASAADLEAPSGISGPVTGVFTIGGRRLFIVEDEGVYHEVLGDFEPVGTFESGKITYALPDAKQFMYLDLATQIEGNDSVEAFVSLDDGPWESIGVLDVNTQSENFDIAPRRGDKLQVRLELHSADGTTTPVVTRFTLLALPVPRRTEQVQVLLDLSQSLIALNGSAKSQDVWEEFYALQELVRQGTPVTYQEFGETYRASLENVQWGPTLAADERNTSWEGPCQVTLKVYAS